MPSLHSRFTNNEFHTAVQSAMGAPLGLLKQARGLPIKPTTSGPTPVIDPFGNNLKKLRGALGGGTTRNHNSIADRFSNWLHGQRCRTSEANRASPRPAKTPSARSAPTTACREKKDGALQEIIPDLVIDGRFLSLNLDGVGAALFRNTKPLVDVKTKSCEVPAGRRRPGSGGAFTKELNRYGQKGLTVLVVDQTPGTVYRYPPPSRPGGLAEPLLGGF
jgi:hypothetical protein